MAASPENLSVTSGSIAPGPDGFLRVSAPAMRGSVFGSTGDAAEIAFVYRGPTHDTSPLASGELRRQIGLKLRAQDTCNVVYVMWHIAPTAGIFVSVKHNPGRFTHAECGALGYTNVRPRAFVQIDPIREGTEHTLRAQIDGNALVATADGARVWEGELPPEAFAFYGPAGIRTDNGVFDFELRVRAAPSQRDQY